MTRKMIRLASSTDVRAAGGADSHLHLASALQEGRKITLCPKASGESRLRGFSFRPSVQANDLIAADVRYGISRFPPTMI
jgi:hypothetical protein